MIPRDRDQAERDLLRALQARVNELKALFEESSNHWGFEDPIYRFYHHSFKVYSLQGRTQAIVHLLGSLLSERPLNAWFSQIADC